MSTAKTSRELDQLVYRTARREMGAGRTPTARDMARLCGCSASSIVRTAQRLGYGGWDHMRDSLLNGQPSEGMVNEGAREQIDATCELLLDHANDVLIVCGIGNGECAAEYFTNRLVDRGFLCMGYRQGTIEAQERLGRSGVMFVFNQSGIVLYDQCVLAQEHGFRVVALTSKPTSPVARAADISVHVKGNKTRPGIYEPDFYCARCIVLAELLCARLDELMG